MAGSYLTHVGREGSGGTPWKATCDGCDWAEEFVLKSKAIAAAEGHWLAMPLVLAERPEEERGS